MTVPLVLKQGLVAQELPGEVGAYPYLNLVAGHLTASAGGGSFRLGIAQGRVFQFALVFLGGWDNGTSAWDNGASTWDITAGGWDNGTSDWDNGTSTWDVTPVGWDNGTSAWDNGTSTWS